jgi:hypothetical protein
MKKYNMIYIIYIYHEDYLYIWAGVSTPHVYIYTHTCYVYQQMLGDLSMLFMYIYIYHIHNNIQTYACMQHHMTKQEHGHDSMFDGY